MSVHKLKDNRWIAKYYKDGKSKRKYFGRGDDARQAAHDFNHSLGLGKPQKARGPLYGDLVADYLQSKKGLIADTSYKISYFRFNKIILPNLGDKPASTLTASVIDEWVSKRLETVKRSTCRRELGDIISVLNHAVSRKKITHNPLAGYRKPKPDDEIIAPPSTDEINSILEHAPPHLQRVIIICTFTGLRPGQKELFNLKYKDVDIGKGIITIESSKKSGIKSRQIPLHKDFRRYLLQWIDADGVNADLHIIRYMGKPIKGVVGAWRNAKKRAGISRRIRLYDIRHAWATHLLTSGGDLRTISRALGHETPAITLQVYSHFSSEVLKSAIDTLPDLKIKPPPDRGQVVKLKAGN